MSASGGQKPQFWANFGIFLGGGLVYRPPFTDEGQIWCAIADPWSTFTCEISSRSVILSSCGGEKHQFLPVLPFFGLRHLVVPPVGMQQSEKVEHGCTTTNLPLTNSIKIVSLLKRRHGEIGRTISDVQKRDEQTDRQTNKKSTFLAAPAAGEIRGPPNLAR